MGNGNGTKLHKALRKLNLRAPSVKLWEKLRVDSFPMSPTSVLAFRDDKDIRKGFFAVYVGEEAKRYAIPLSYLKHPIFLELLRKAEEEFGFDNVGSGALQIPCDPVVFERLLSLIGKEDDILPNGLSLLILP